MLIVSYICTALNYVFYCTSRFAKEKQTMLLLDFGAKILTIIALYLMGSLSGSYSFIIMFFAIIIASIKEKKNKRWIPVYIIIELLYICILIITFEGISSILIFTSSSLTIFAIWFLKPQGMRKIGIIGSILYLLFQISIKNWMGLLEIVVLLSNIFSLIKYTKKEA